ncbi:LemA family protein [Labrys monachus]|uniref:LemA protein n=1 Tax=Labrys monachus TaxID=217067 RepID=A0ABU0FDW8_9HYPH|nr:LemA family protein [Labrys monachus]MDQ0392313.1 LemA protein [Labrys monachus]
MTSYIILGIVAVVALYAITAYNGLIRNKNLTAEGWSGIDVQLRRRADLIPNLVETVKGYATHEKGVFEAVTQARAASLGAKGVGAKSAAEGGLQAALANLFAVAEAYPTLKADANFRDLQSQLSGIEDDIQASRRYYNGAARNFNTQIESFPSNLIANAFHFQKAEYFEIGDEAARTAPKVSFGTP